MENMDVLPKQLIQTSEPSFTSTQSSSDQQDIMSQVVPKIEPPSGLDDFVIVGSDKSDLDKSMITGNLAMCTSNDKDDPLNISEELAMVDNFEFDGLNSYSTLMEEKCGDVDIFQKCFTEATIPTRGKPSEIFKFSKKRLAGKEISRRGGKVVVRKASALTQLTRKRGTRGKRRSLIMFTDRSHNNDLLDRNGNGRDMDMSSDNKLLFFSAKDEFILNQDICVMCGAVGAEEEGQLIACIQCGQCYHPYCVSVQVSKQMLEKGWRCLDCTICEGCGQKNDEARLILCDECDISYHIYCMNPPLDTVPHGAWKCKDCAVCHKCGRRSPGKKSQWMNNSSECGPCASQKLCCVCLKPYIENTLIIECANCERWLHCSCDSIYTEAEAEECDNDNYYCILCRAKDEKPIHLAKLCTNGNKPGSPVVQANDEGGQNVNLQKTERWLDGVCVSEHGLNVIKMLGSEIKKKRKVHRGQSDVQNQDSMILAAIESVVAGGSVADNIVDGSALNQEIQSKKSEFFKDGMVWTTAPDAAPPEGFSVLTNDEGISILRKKRQRNLQKVGIGGFMVRNRTVKKDLEESTTVIAGDNLSTAVTDKKKKPIRKKVKNKIAESFPSYLQEAFFGKSLLESSTTTSSSFWESNTNAVEESDNKEIVTNETQNTIKSQPQECLDFLQNKSLVSDTANEKIVVKEENQTVAFTEKTEANIFEKNSSTLQPNYFPE